MKKLFVILLICPSLSLWANQDELKFQNELYNQIFRTHRAWRGDNSTEEELSLELIRLRLRPWASFNIEGVADVKVAPSVELYWQKVHKR